MYSYSLWSDWLLSLLRSCLLWSNVLPPLQQRHLGQISPKSPGLLQLASARYLAPCNFSISSLRIIERLDIHIDLVQLWPWCCLSRTTSGLLFSPHTTCIPMSRVEAAQWMKVQKKVYAITDVIILPWFIIPISCKSSSTNQHWSVGLLSTLRKNVWDYEEVTCRRMANGRGFGNLLIVALILWEILWSTHQRQGNDMMCVMIFIVS